MKSYLTLVTTVSLAGFYIAVVVLARVMPGLALGVKDGEAIRGSLATALGFATAMLPLWLLHWSALRRLWISLNEARPRYLFVITSIGVLATAITAGQLVTELSRLFLSTRPISNAGLADLFGAIVLFLTSLALWSHHWRLLRQYVATTPATKSAVSHS
jgi:hypothetical protein